MVVLSFLRKKSLKNKSSSGEKTRRGLFKNLGTRKEKPQQNGTAKSKNEQKKKRSSNSKTKTIKIPRTQAIDPGCGYESSTSTTSRSYISQIDLQQERGLSNYEIAENQCNINNNQDYGYGIPDYRNNDENRTTTSYEGTDYGYGEAIPDNRSQQQQYYDDNDNDLGYIVGYAKTPTTITRVSPLLSSSSDHQTPRRSSLKKEGKPRRASIGYTGEMTLLLPNGQEKKKRTSISFVDETDNQIKEVKPIHEMVDDNNRLWFQAEEYLHIKEEIYRVVKQSQSQQQQINNITTCTRGLESYKNRNVEDARREASSQVIEEYMLQKARGEYDDEIIRQMYTFHTIDCEVEAAERGQNDEKSIQTYMKDTRNQLRRMSC